MPTPQPSSSLPSAPIAPSTTAAPSFYSRAYRDTPTLWVMGQRLRILVDSTVTSGRYSLVENYAPSCSEGPPPHAHEDADATFLILEGGLKIVIEGHTHVAHVNDTVIIPRKSLHTFANPFLTPCRFLVQFTPGGLEGFFRELGVPGAHGPHSIKPPPPPATPMSPQQFKQVAIKHHMRVPGLTDV